MRLAQAILVSLSLMTTVAHADSLSVVDVRKNIPLSDDEPAYKDFYLAGGDLSGLKKNLVITAMRKVAVRDSKGAQSYGEIEIPVGQLRVLTVYGSVAVAREYKLLSRDDHAMLEQTGIMSGDLIDLKDSFVDTKPLPKPKKVSEFEAAPEAGRATASVLVAPVAPAAASIPAPTAPAPALATPVAAPTATPMAPVSAPESASAPSAPASSDSASSDFDLPPEPPQALPAGLPVEFLQNASASNQVEK